jgi:flotillin
MLCGPLVFTPSAFSWAGGLYKRLWLLWLPQLFCLHSRLNKRQALVVMSERSMNMALIIGIVAVLIIIFGFLCYKKAPPTEAIVVTGFGLSKPKVVSGKGTFVLPVLQRADKLNMRLLKIDVKTPETGVKTQNGVSLWIDSVVTIQVYSENSTVLDDEVKASGLKDAKAYIMSRQQAAISNFLGMNEQGINDKVNDVLQGNLREIVSDMTVDQILTNRKQMALSVIENARPDLAKMGLEVVTFNVQDIRDAIDAQGHNHGVIEAIGIEQEELVKKQAEIARAQAARDVACAKADAEMAANAKEVEAQTAIAQRNNELQLAKAKLKAEADKAAADADAAGRIQMNLRAKEIKEAEADAEIAKQKKMVDLAAQEAEVQQRKLDAEVRKQADADLYRRQKEAEAKKYEAERAAEAAKFAKQQEAEGIEMVGKAEAEATRQKGLAEAEAMKQKAEAYKQYNDAAVAEMLIKVLPDIAKSVAQPLSSIDKVSIIGGDASGVSGVSGNVPVLMAQTMQTVKEATGIDMGEIVRANSIQAKTDRNIHIDGVELDEPKTHITSERVEDGWMFHEKDPITGEDKTSFRPDFTDEEKATMDAHAKAAENHATTNKTNPYKKGFNK